VGKNGCGKSTLLKILAAETGASGSGSGSDVESGGNVDVPLSSIIKYNGVIEKGKDCHVVFVEQEPPMSSDVTVSEALLGITQEMKQQQQQKQKQQRSTTSSSNSLAIVREYKLASDQIEHDPQRFEDATNNMNSMDSSTTWDILTKSDEIATRLQIHSLLPQPLSNLSGGERKRVALASAFLQSPDVLLLDEPTNHLDLQGIHHLTQILKMEKKLTVLIVTHDRAFLDETCTSILELDRGSLYSYPGDYQQFLQGKAERLALEDASIRAANVRYKKELDWMRRQPQARETKQKYRIQAFQKLEQARKTQKFRKQQTDSKITLDDQADQQRRMGNFVLRVQDASLSFDKDKGKIKTVLNEFSYDFNKGDRIGIVGPNGVGKSTFLKVLTGQQTIDSGSIDVGETVVFGIYDQMGILGTTQYNNNKQQDPVDNDNMDDNQTVLDFVKQKVEARDGSSMAEAPSEAMKLLKQFQFERNRWNERLSMLSGGEKRRLQLLSVLTKKPNFLILDEPTNDIDLDTLDALEDYLQNNFDGVLIIVSHDRFFADKVTNHLFVFEGDGIVQDYNGSLSDYAQCLLDDEPTTDATTSMTSSTTKVGGVSTSNGNSYKQDKKARNEVRNAIRKTKREMDKIESTIEKMKKQVEELQSKIDNTSSDEGWSVLAEMTKQMNEIQENIELNEMTWLELAETLEEIEQGED